MLSIENQVSEFVVVYFFLSVVGPQRRIYDLRIDDLMYTGFRRMNLETKWD